MKAGSGSRAITAIALWWLPVAFVCSLPAYLWHQNYFRNTGFYFLMVRALPLLCAASLGYALWLRPLVRRYELPLLLLFPAAACVAVAPAGSGAVALVAFAALVMGDCFTPVFAFEGRDAPLVWTCGFGVLISIGTLLGKLAVLSRPTLAVLLVLCLCRAAFVWRRLRSWLALPFAAWKQGGGLTSAIPGVCVFFLFFFAATGLLLALTPVTVFDVLAYHFPLARHYAQTHSVQPTPWIPESYFPQGGEVLLAIGFALVGEPAARLFVPVLSVLFLWLLVRVGMCCGITRAAAVTGAAMAAAFPFLHWTLSVSKNDADLALFQLGALYSFLQWRKGRGVAWLLLMAFLLGQTAGIKHVALFGLVGMAPLCLFAWIREKFSWRLAAAAGLIFAASGLFWHVQTWVLTGSPVYPQASHASFHTPNQEHGGRAARAAMRYATLPWYLLFHGEKAFESNSPNPLGISCFLFLPAVFAGLLTARWNPARTACLVFAVVYILYWCSILSTLRYAIVPFALLALAMGAALNRERPSSSGVRIALAAFTSYSFLFALLVAISIGVNSMELAVLLKRITPEEFLERTIPRVEPLFRLARQFPGAAAFAVDSGARYYAPNPMRFSYLFCAEGCRTDQVLRPLGNRLFEFAILPKSGQFLKMREAITAKFGATVVDSHGEFVILRLSPDHAPQPRTP